MPLFKKTVPLRPHPLARGKLAQRASDLLGRAWAKGWLPEPELNAQALWQMAAKGADPAAESGGRSAEDVADFRERFERLCSAATGEADLNPLGRAMAFGQLQRAVKNRLAFGALWNAQPQLLQTHIAPPIIVIGHMRSGTTRIHKLLAADPAHSHTRYRDAYHPVPTPLGLSRVKSAAELAMLGALNPWMLSIHPMAANEVEEELAWIAAALNHSIYESQWHIPSYSAFSETRDPAPIYREFTRMLRSDAAHRGNAALPRVMKVPAFSEDLDTLLSIFPDARLVVAQRDKDAVLRSAVSLAANQMAVQSDTCDLARITAFWQRKIALREKRMAAALSQWDGPIAHLHFDALGDDWESEIRRVYGELAIGLSAQAITAMRAQMAGSKDGHHRAHAEQLRRFENQP